MTKPEIQAALNEAMHLLFDVKDHVAAEGGSTLQDQPRYQMYEAIKQIEAAAQTLGVTLDRRFDGEGR